MIVDHITVRETVAFDDAAEVKRTRDGYLVAVPRVARTGIQVYLGQEVGRPDMDRVRVYRPADEVFHKAAMSSIAHRPVTNGHPSEPVTADNWRKHAVGQVDGEVARDGEFVRVPMVVMDGPTIADVENGKKELSLGYSADLVWQEGMTSDGQAYDAVQTNIRVNHLAIVDAARGGPKLAIGDQDANRTAITAHKSGDEIMNEPLKQPLKSILVDGLSVEMTDNAAQVVQRYEAQLKDAVKSAQDALAKVQADTVAAKAAADKAVADAQAAVATKDAELAAVKKQLEDAVAKSAPAALDARVKERHELIGKATAVLGDKLVIEGKTDAEIRRQVVDSKLAEASKDFSDDQVATAFVIFTKDVKAEDNVTKGTNAADQINRSFGTPQKDSRSEAKRKYDADISNAWKGA
jgi:uncharacterized protein